MLKARQKQEKKELKKHSASVQIQNNITLLQRKMWNVMLWNAFEEIPEKDIHDITVQQIMRLVGYDSKDDAYVKEAVLAMMNCIVEWDILDKDGSEVWGAAVLLASVQIKHGICSYGFAPHLRQKLYNPDMFARLDLDMQKRFESKHSLALWELCTDYLGAKRDYGETPWIPLGDFRRLMGIAEDQYYLYKLFNQRVLSPALDEINRVSDFRVSMDYQRQGRKITALKFKIRRVTLLPEAVTGQGHLFPDLEDMPVIVKELKDAGLSAQDALEIWQQGFGFVDEAARPADPGDNAEAAFMQYVREKIHLLKRRQARGKIENSTGFLLKAIRENYANPEFAQEQKSQAAVEEQRATRGKAKELKALREKIEELRDEEDTALMALSNRVIEESPVLLEQAIAALREDKNAGFSFCYEPERSPMDNYRRHVFIADAVAKWLEGRFSERYDEARVPFHRQRAEIEARIKALEGEGIKVLAYA